MAQDFPYTYYSCDCYDSVVVPTTLQAKRASQHSLHSPADYEEDERTFDPRSPRANYSLYPLEHLLYCEDCRQIRCPRCVSEEVICWFCPSCLFEVPSSMVKSDGNRCARNCYNCPICTSPMMVNSLEAPRQTADGEEERHAGGPYYLACSYCKWTSLDIGVEFEKHNNLTQQLARIRNGGKVVPSLKGKERERDNRRKSGMVGKPAEDTDATMQSGGSEDPPSRDELYLNLSAFYRDQLAQISPANPFSPHAELNFGSPSSFSRIMNLYTTSKKLRPDKPQPMREAIDESEGLQVIDPAAEAEEVSKLKYAGFKGTLSLAQKFNQLDPTLRFLPDVRPVPALLRTKRSRRCRTCRQILSRPETKITSTRYKIKVLAQNNIPRLSIRVLAAPYNPWPVMSLGPPSTATTPGPGPAPFNYDALPQNHTIQYLLTLTNPLFDPIRVTLATPAITPGRIASKVTILCPQFDVGANTDVWDEALNSDSVTAGGGGGSATSSSRRNQPSISTTRDQAPPPVSHKPKRGKIWDRGRNWTGVIIEVVPGALTAAADENLKTQPLDDLDEDEDVLEIPVFVRIEYETETTGEEKATAGGLGEHTRSGGGQAEAVAKGKVRREEAFWCVLGVGRIAAS